MKKIFIILFSLILSTSLFALPGFVSYVPDISGEFVFYRDYSFARESYIGLLSYDDTSYQIKYYAPASKTLVLPEKEIAILFSVNPDSDFMDITGEKIISEINPDSEDFDILNYLHDILYEFSARRIKIDSLAAQPYASTQDYEQFGGKVIINFDSLIPLFNIDTITTADKKTTILSCVTFGRIVDNDDKTFDNFHGMPEAKPYHAPTVKKIKGKSKKFTTADNQTITLDSNWTQVMDNAWTYGDEGFITIASVPQYFIDKNMNDIFVLRRIIESTDSSYTNFEQCEVLTNTKTFTTKVTAYNYQPENNQIIYTIKEITTDPSKELNSYISIAAMEDSYLSKSNYYAKILKTFKEN